MPMNMSRDFSRSSAYWSTASTIAASTAVSITVSACIAGSCSAWKVPEMEYSSRSEEHTSELQSRGLISYAVFCLKKNTQSQAQRTVDVGVGHPYHTAVATRE